MSASPLGRTGVPMLTPQVRALLEEIVGAPVGEESAWVEALTHGSTELPCDYQRLEFLGDRVLGLTIAEWLYERERGDEGLLSQRLNVLVSRQNCAAIARRHALGSLMRMGKQARDDGGADSDNILGDALEALIGASFVVRGFATTRAMVRSLWSDAVAGEAGMAKHPKSALQEWAAGNRRKPPTYKTVARDGPDHAARFTIMVSVTGVGEVQADGSSKQEAETAAAAQFMERFG